MIFEYFYTKYYLIVYKLNVKNFDIILCSMKIRFKIYSCFKIMIRPIKLNIHFEKSEYKGAYNCPTMAIQCCF